MPLLTILIVLIVVGVILWLVEKYIPMNVTIKRIFFAVVIIIVVIWLLRISGILGSLNSVRI